MLDYEERVLGIIRTFFLFHRGRWYSSRGISEWLQENKQYFRLHNYGDSLSPGRVSVLLNRNYFDDLETKYDTKKRRLYRYK